MPGIAEPALVVDQPLAVNLTDTAVQDVNTGSLNHFRAPKLGGQDPTRGRRGRGQRRFPCSTSHR
ncbi:hypothetical protein ACQP1W_27985 [Spirillospora sp. CA-255316]